MPLQPRARAALGKLRRRFRPKPAAAPPAKAPTKRPRRESLYQALPGDRLLERPVFVLSSIRSGSTLLRVMLNSHSAIHAPHETHLGGVRVEFGGRYAREAMNEIGLDEVQLDYLLWDRLLHREMTRHGKRVLVNKTPSDAFRWRRILDCWPDVRFIFLLRHPAAIADSWSRARPDVPMPHVVRTVLPFMTAVEEARSNNDGLTVRYEDVTNDPESEMKRICAFLELDYEPAMVEYGQADHGSFKRGLGDWSERILSGKVHPVERLPRPEDIPPGLREICATWGYLAEE